MTEARDMTIDIVKGIAIILVVCGHVIQYTVSLRGQDYFLNPGFKFIYTFHMPLFIFISGYLMAFSLRKRRLLDIFKIRFQTLLVPCIAWGILGVITSYAVYLMDGEKLVSGAWFIWFLYTLFAVSALLLCSVALEKRIGILSFLVIYLLLLFIPYNSYASLYNIKWFYPFYMAGYFLSRYEIKITNPWINTVAFLASVSMFMVLASYWTRNDFIHNNQMNFMSDHYIHETLRIVYRYVVGFLGILITCYVGMGASRAKIGQMLGYLGTYAMGIYVIQRYIIEGIYPRLLDRTHVNMDTNSPLFYYVFVPLVAAAGIWICLLILNLIFKKNDLLNRLLLGGRG